MDLIHGVSPRFRAPLSGWEIAPLGKGPKERREGDGELRLRVGYCAAYPAATIAERMIRVQKLRQDGDPIVTQGHLRSSLVPVVLVDGEAVASGWGSITVPLAPGRHLVEVQSQHSRAWRAVEISAGKAARIDYVGMLGDQHRAYGELEVPRRLRHLSGHALGPRGRFNYWQYLPANARERRSFIAAILMMFLAPLTFYGLIRVGVFEDGALSQEAGFAIAFGLPILAVGFWGLRVLWTYLRYNRCRPEPPLERAGGPVVLDREGEVPEPSPGAAALLIDARFLKADLTSADLARQFPQGQTVIDRSQARALNRVGEIVPVAHRFAVPSPRIELAKSVGGLPLFSQEIAASWTRMWIEVPPGEYTITARTPAAPLPVRGVTRPENVRTEIVKVGPGKVATCDLVVEVTAVPDPAERALHLWQCAIATLGPRDEPKSRRAPRVDVRGGMRRMVNGRYWESGDGR
ncbi:hypothetical protein AB0B28_02165 [Glycomyces sp. NPDC046736]|uniref:hypothetical protein n=1 Tax=Glycomyces sp. NPDC046736 TaxID=3155615 RepID=UPI0033E79A97